MKEVFTTGDVAGICRVTINTVVKWFDSGKLKGYRIPSSKARRIPKKNLVSFMKEYGFPMDAVFTDKTVILVVDNEKTTQSLFRRVFSNKDLFILNKASSGFEAGLRTADMAPDIIFLNIGLGDADQTSICKILRSSEKTAGTAVFALSGKLRETDIKKLKKLGFAEVLTKPLKSRDVRKAVSSHIAQQQGTPDL